jgi:Flp pilus assembly protein TadD
MLRRFFALLSLASLLCGCSAVRPASKVAAGEASLKRGDYAAAKQAFDEALRYRPNDPRLALIIARAWISHNRWREAVDVLEKAAARTRDASIYSTLGLCYHNLNELDRAEEAYLQALKLQPNDPLVLNNLGYMWADQGRNLRTAIKLLEKARQLAPKEAFIMDSLGWAYYRQAVEDLKSGRRKQAEKLLTAARDLVEKAVDRNPGEAEQHYHLGMIYASLGYERDAEAELRRAFAVNPKLTKAKDALDSLSSIPRLTPSTPK